MPLVGLGTYLINDKDSIVRAITECGYRHLDTAHYYENEHIVGDAIAASIATGKVTREDLFIVTKIWPTDLLRAEELIKKQLSDLKLEYIDCYLIHWPSHFFTVNTPLYKIWADLEKLVDSGLTKSLGISNFNL
jgi:diketogulonate reductase-like aldo/keto reductase